jgi:hypothetical protein
LNLTDTDLGRILFQQHPINHTFIEALLCLHKIHRKLFELSIPDQSPNAGIMVAMDGNSQLLVTSYGIKGRSQEPPASHLVQNAEQSSRERQQETDTWHTKSASNGETPTIKKAKPTTK